MRTLNLIFIFVLCATVLTFYQGLSGDFVFDDISSLVKNNFLNSDNSSFFEHLKSAIFSSDSGPLKRPISLASFALNTYFTGLNPYYLKLTNLIIHLLNGLLIFCIIKKLLDQAYTTAHSQNLALLVSSIFLLHPLCITSVLYVVQRMTSLSALFSLSGIFLYISARNKNTTRGNWLILTGVPVFTILATLSKENGLLLPYYCLLIEIIFFRFLNAEGTKNTFIILLCCLILIPALSSIIFLCFNPDWLINSYVTRPFTFTERILTEPRILFLYLRLILVPDISLMGLYHDDIQTSLSLFSPWTSFLSIIGLIPLMITAAISYRKAPVFCFGVFFFFIGHSMESTIFPLELAHEHRNYLPMLGPLFILVYYADKVTTQLKKNIRRILAFTFLVMLGLSTSIRAHHWGDLVTHAISEVSNHPDSHRANYEAGRIFQKVAASGKYDIETAYQASYNYFKKAQNLKPDDAGTLLSFIHTNYIIGKEPSTELYNRLYSLLNSTPIHSATYNIINAFTQCTIAKKCTPTESQLNEIYNQTLYNPKVGGKGKASVLISAADYFSSINDYITSIRYLHIAVQSHDSFLTRFILTKALLKLNLFSDAENQLVIMKNKDYYFFHKSKIDRLTNIMIEKM